MIDFIRADHIHICVPKERLEEAKIFYTDVMGLQLIDRPNHLFSTAGYWLNIGNIQLHIGVEPFKGRSIRHTAFEVADITAARAHLQKNHIEITEEPAIPGRTRFAFIDPFGNRMELLQLID
ncbi:glyoxalase/bleomycin resistance protein/dioxygenase superfamily protein [Mucilaginibacter frigoritolerans]|uniref:Glyoxalase/bleomycin resistance protein/dioxygenase superfamily protein n=1 Tax=Mucilaginibacter frigoritolerans TaxID=652788 RepID=A0A562TYQ5_9SPHI|nr:VOC family protein [Mucilaginibacter frigoritolerans]TWI98732.1 glyoxalase/bleomycin resistance protein/dioxygenase superfamily protein [Mucilaginibacter frigoritolerans]